MFLGLVRKRPKHVCSALNDYREKIRKTQQQIRNKTQNTVKKPQTTRKSWNLVVFFVVFFFFEFQNSKNVSGVGGPSAEFFPPICLERHFFGSGGSRLRGFFAQIILINPNEKMVITLLVNCSEGC